MGGDYTNWIMLVRPTSTEKVHGWCLHELDHASKTDQVHGWCLHELDHASKTDQYREGAWVVLARTGSC